MSIPKIHEKPEAGATRCKKCGAPIFFAETDAGRSMPLSVATHDKKAVPYIRDGRMMVTIRDIYDSHFADCPHANSFRSDH